MDKKMDKARLWKKYGIKNTRDLKWIPETPTKHGLKIYEFLGKVNGNSEGVSITLEEFAPGASSHPHYLKKRDEYQYVLEGRGTLFIGNEKREVTAGDFVKIPAGKVHKIFTDHQLKLYCFVNPAWIQDDAVFVDNMLAAVDPNQIEAPKPLGIELIEMNEGFSIEDLQTLSKAPLDFVENSILILKGQGTIVVDGQEYPVTSGELIKIPFLKTHQIFNNHKETLQYFNILAPKILENSMKV